MLDLLVVNPGGARTIYQDLSEALTAIEPPLWCRLIAGYCRDRGHSVDILDAEALSLTPAQISARVRERAPRLVCVAAYGHQPSASTQSMDAVVEICRHLAGERVIVVGGHAAALPVMTARETGAMVCNSEGPVTVERLLCGELWDVPGLAGRGGQNPPPPLLDVKELHGDVWDMLPMSRYRAHNWQCFDGSPRQPYASIYTSLGCPYKCSFCCINAPFGTNRYRMRDPVEVVAEVAMLYRKYGVRTLKIVDEMFVLNERHYRAICDGLAGLPFAEDLNIWAYARVDTVKPETLALLRSAGIRWLALGIESGSAHVRDGAEKALSDGDIFETVRAIQSAGISVIGNFIFGLPDDTHDTMRETLDLAKALNCEFANFYSAMAYPGSRLFEQASPADLPANWSGYSQHSRDTTPLPNARLSSRDIVRFRDAAFHEYFESPRYLDMVGARFGAHAVAEVQAMTAKRLERAA